MKRLLEVADLMEAVALCVILLAAWMVRNEQQRDADARDLWHFIRRSAVQAALFTLTLALLAYPHLWSAS